LKTKVAFFKESIKNFKTTGTIMPSSRYLIKRMLNDIDFNNANVIVEYGPGNGIITNHLLEKMHQNTKLICFEINDEFYKHLSLINDERLILIKQSAENILEVLKKHNISQVDYFISSLPLTMIPKDIAVNILQLSKKSLKSKGFFIQYQYSINFLKIFKQIFGENNVLLSFEILNLPPAFIYKCRKIN
jgi:phospholipid N-methyltransferase